MSQQSSSQSPAQAQRHTACKMCRDKKVRCDGEQPACSKCLRSGEQCVYAPIVTPTRATLASMVKDLQERLGNDPAPSPCPRAPCPCPHRRLTMCPLAERAEARLPGMAPTPPQGPAMMSVPAVPSYEAYAYDPTMASSRPSFMPIPVCAQPPLPPSLAEPSPSPPPQPLFVAGDTDGPTYQVPAFPVPMTSTEPMPPLSAEEEADLTMGEPGLGSPRFSHLPSISELRSLALGGGGGGGDGMGAGSPSALNAVEALVLEMTESQAETSCVLGALTEYLAWIILMPETGHRAAEVLRILRTRVQELRQQSDAKLNAAYNRMCSSLEGINPVWHTHMVRLEPDLQAARARTREFFEERYNLSHPLSEQRA